MKNILLLLNVLLFSLSAICQEGPVKNNTAQSSTGSTKKSIETLLSKSLNKPFPKNQIGDQISIGQNATSFIGLYNIHAGVQKNLIGTLILQSDGEYKVSLVSDAERIATGIYEYSAKSSSLAWTGGFFLSKRFKGELGKDELGRVKIYLSPSTYAVKVD